MFDLLKKIRDIIVGGFEAMGTFFTWVGELIGDIANVAVNAGQAVVNVSTWLSSWLPPEALALFMSIIAIVVVYKILGREG